MNTPQLATVRAPTVAAGGTTMTAIVQDRYGSEPADALRLTEIDKPTIAAHQVLVRVRAASVDRGTWHIMAGLPYPIRLAGFGLRRPKCANPGRNLAGTVEAIGAGVTGFAPGAEVFGTATSTFAEYAVAEPGKLAPKPTNLSYDQAASVPVSGMTALQAVRDHGNVQAGEKVLVIGASGGVGSFAVQIAKAFGAEVTGVAGTGKLEMVRALGADHVLDHTRVDFADGGPSFDVILDIGGNSGLARLRRALTPRGRVVIVGGETDGRLLGGSGRQIRAKLLSPFVSQQLGTFIASENAGDLRALAEIIEAGKVTPAIDRTYPLAETAAAIRRLLDGRTRGKLVVSVSAADMPTPGSRSTT
ncbi:MAG: Alcohol dehydrogenase zinc-binding domain protein [Frankiales bacterium]|nr:Alcohol dehydrogenase zinc-binding domain protein [Frankiales bacterium]